MRWRGRGIRNLSVAVSEGVLSKGRAARVVVGADTGNCLHVVIRQDSTQQQSGIGMDKGSQAQKEECSQLYDGALFRVIFLELIIPYFCLCSCPSRATLATKINKF